jgi:hypothetical protein
MIYVGILVVSGLLVAPILSRIIYFDTARRSLSSSIRLPLTALFGISSFGGFLVPYLFDEQLGYLYFQVLKPRPIAVTPTEWLIISISVGVLSSLLLVGVYLASVRFIPSEIG